ncbi:MAG: UDP-3-O-acyl-N-acetylglucosamine deacetylase, partial [Planctomycetota bacterium]|nr:UDP-3-O-acyl-N-acetylglucosamine deacetylase [Planctomycetota bacterium]
MKLQKTIKSEGRMHGRGLFGGKEAKVVFRPAPADSGIAFIRTDIPEPVRITAVASNVAERSRRTTLKKGSVSIETVEHCMAAVNALEIDNVIVEVNGPELPASDCSCAEYFKTLRRTGLVEQNISRKEYVIDKP